MVGGETSATASGEGNLDVERGRSETVTDRGRLRVTWERHPAVVTLAQAAGRSRDRGCKGHRILRRVLADGRHPGSHEPLPVMGRWSRWSRRLLPSPRHSRRRAAPRVEEGEATGMSEARSQKEPWEENTHARLARRTPPDTEGHEAARVLFDPPKRSRASWNAWSPGQAAQSPDSARRPRGESRGSDTGNARGAGARSFV